MTDRKQDGLEAACSGAGEQAAARRKYSRPTLRHLGSVREITLGGTKGTSETGGHRTNG